MTRSEEALLVAAVVSALFEASGEPVGNFRAQKAVYFARRRLGEDRLDHDFLRMAAGPYNPAMRYEGGIAIAKKLGFIREARGRFGFGYISGSQNAVLAQELKRYPLFAEIANWVRDRLRFVPNERWEILATVDYAVKALEAAGERATPDRVLDYISADHQWRGKIARLNLTAFAVESSMLEAEALFGDRAARHAAL